jgi:hypothetical protein
MMQMMMMMMIFVIIKKQQGSIFKGFFSYLHNQMHQTFFLDLHKQCEQGEELEKKGSPSNLKLHHRLRFA